jgi:hypothetical protein
LAEKLDKKLTNVARDVTTPLEKMHLIYNEIRPTTRPGSSRPKTTEHAWYLKKTHMEETFDVLYSIFFERHLNDLVSESAKPNNPTYVNYIAGIRAIDLA